MASTLVRSRSCGSAAWKLTCGPPSYESPRAWRCGPSLGSPAIGGTDTGGPALAEISPCEGIAISQDVLESVLRDHVCRQPGATFSVNTEFVGLTRTGSAVRAQLLDRNTGDTFSVCARYLVGADGWRSAVRSALGFSMAGPDDLGTNRAITFRADLSQLARRTPTRPGPTGRRVWGAVAHPRRSPLGRHGGRHFRSSRGSCHRRPGRARPG